MAEILVKVTSWLSLLPRISVGNILEIVIISFLVYELLVWIKNTRAWNLLKGLLVILVFVLFAAVLHLTTILWILENTTTIAVTALLVIFQPELRKALEQLGSRNYMSYLFSFDEGKDNQGFNDKTINELVRATFEMAKVKTGALMVIERGSSLKEIERTGIEINGLVTSQLLINIFEHNTPLHDGAIIVRGDRIVSATCYLPLSDNMGISKELGTRHRAAVGMSEVSDALIVTVSEETGYVSVAMGGQLVRNVTPEYLKKRLESISKKSVEIGRLKKIWKGWRSHEKGVD